MLIALAKKCSGKTYPPYSLPQSYATVGGR